MISSSSSSTAPVPAAAPGQTGAAAAAAPRREDDTPSSQPQSQEAGITFSTVKKVLTFNDLTDSEEDPKPALTTKQKKKK